MTLRASSVLISVWSAWSNLCVNGIFSVQNNNYFNVSLEWCHNEKHSVKNPCFSYQLDSGVYQVMPAQLRFIQNCVTRPKSRMGDKAVPVVPKRSTEFPFEETECFHLPINVFLLIQTTNSWGNYPSLILNSACARNWDFFPSLK